MESNALYVKYGLLIAAALIAYFLLIRLIGLHDNHWLRVLNGVIVAYGIYAVIKKKKDLEKDDFEYFSGFGTGILTGVIATFVFVLFMGIYLFHIEPPFAEMLMSYLAGTGGPEILLLILAIEGVSSSVILSLTFMQKFKVSRNISEKPVTV
ncbi:MAG: DUF4199 domain-containing protein [Flavobacteriaceae bacterium]|nr:DUF4199 domain-containing protein [Flavobacteriaceae bacterium]